MLNSEIKAVFKNNERSEYFPVILNKNKGINSLVILINIV